MNPRIHVDWQCRRPPRSLRTRGPDHRTGRCRHDEILFSKGDSQTASRLSTSCPSAKKRSNLPLRPLLARLQKCREQDGKKSGKGSKPTKGQATRSVKNRTTRNSAVVADSSG